MNNFIYELNVEKWVWTKIPQKPIKGRFGHSSLTWQNSIIIFGGEFGFNNTTKKRECTNEMFSFDLNQNKWTEIETVGSPQYRRNFGFASMGDKYLVVYGGINPIGSYLNDIIFLNMGNFIYQT
jgi:N-acetylneuraminic acid mutarotase